MKKDAGKQKMEPLLAEGIKDIHLVNFNDLMKVPSLIQLTNAMIW